MWISIRVFSGWELTDVLLIEADGKALLAEHGITVPDGVLATDTSLGELPEGPWIVKAQVPVGGRGKAGGVMRCETPQDVAAALHTMLGHRLKGHQVAACLIEQIAAGEERYLAVMIDAASYGLRVLYASQGGVDIEQSDAAQSRLCAPHAAAVAEALTELAAEPMVVALGRKLAEMLLQRE